jgi:hypothetical protein
MHKNMENNKIIKKVIQSAKVKLALRESLDASKLEFFDIWDLRKYGKFLLMFHFIAPMHPRHKSTLSVDLLNE